jgi:uncharacterized protein
MDDLEQRIKAIEEEIRTTPYDKSTQRHIGLLRAKISKLKDQQIEKAAKSGGGGGGFAHKKHGDATVALVGFPSVGKSTLINKITNANSRTAEYAFTTLTAIPGMMEYKGAQVQIMDVPGIIEGAAGGRGRGREVLSVIRNADLLLIMVASGHEEDFEKIESELYRNGVRINQSPPNVFVKKTAQGGLHINSSVKLDLDRDTILDICKEHRLVNADIIIQEKLTLDRLIDSFSPNRIYVPSLRVLTKVDLNNNRKIEDGTLGISAETGFGIDQLKDHIWNMLEFKRIYLKNPFGGTDFEDPLIMRGNVTLKDVAIKVGNEFAEDKEKAKIWGPGSKFPGQTVSLSAPVVDEVEVMFA